MNQTYEYNYTLMLAVNTDDLKRLDAHFNKIDLMNVEFQTVQGSKLIKFGLSPTNVVFAILKNPTPKDSVSAVFFPVRGGAATKAESDLQFISIPLRPGMTDKEILNSLETDGCELHSVVKYCRHYGLFAVALER